MEGRCIANECLNTTGFSYTLSLINGKYKMVILYCLMEFGVVRYSELKRYIRSISHKTLSLSLKELEKILASYKTLHNKTDVDSVQRAIRAIEIEEFYKKEAPDKNEYPPINSLIIGIDIDRELRREKITRRLYSRLEEGMVEEVQRLLATGITPEDLIYYGLEYKYLTLYITGKLSYDEMVDRLEIAIHQFAKRQMTWFRGMERRGFFIHWVSSACTMKEKIEFAMQRLHGN